jgi:vanillate O-demethylase monooxygenase subunit
MTYSTRFPRNRWYVAARSQEVVGGTMLARRLLGRPVVMFRDGTGAPVALEDRCPHRQMPLSLGSLCGDVVQCAYHGMRFDATGACIGIPSQEAIPARMRATSFPVVEQGSLIWIWPGDASLADVALLPEYPWAGQPGWATASGTLHVRARAQVLNENLLDLSHLPYLHPESIGTQSMASFPVTVTSTDTTVTVDRPMPASECPELFRRAMGLSGLIDRGQTAEFQAPGFNTTHVSATPVGVPEGDGVFMNSVFMNKVSHGVTPETEHSTHYFWMSWRNFAVDDDELTEELRHSLTTVFAQDVVACEAIEQTIQMVGDHQIVVQADRGAMLCRRILERLVHDEDVLAGTAVRDISA